MRGNAAAPLAPPSELAPASLAAGPHLQTAWEVRSASWALQEQAPPPFAASRIASAALVHAHQQRTHASAGNHPRVCHRLRTRRRRLGQQAGVHCRVLCPCRSLGQRASIHAVRLAGRSANDAHTRPCRAGSPCAWRTAVLKRCRPQARSMHSRRSVPLAAARGGLETGKTWHVRARERG